MRIALVVSAVALILVGSWLMQLRVRASRLAEEMAALRRETEARQGEVA